MKRNKYLNAFDTTSEYDAYIESDLSDFPNVGLTMDDGKLHYIRISPKDHVFYGEVVDPSKAIPTISLNNTVITPKFQILNNTFYLDNWTNASPTSISFDNKSNIKTITKFKLLNTSNVTDMTELFYECTSLTSLDLTNFNTSNVTNMYNMFNGCSSLTSLDLSNFNTSNVTEMYQMFRNCSSLTSLDLSNFNTYNVTNMLGMFEGCSSLTSLYLSNFNTSNINTSLSSMFEGCSSLTSLDLSSFNTSNINDISRMFYGCTSLTSLYLSNWDTSNVTYNDVMFYGCTSLTDVYINVEATLMKLTNNLTSQGSALIPSTATIHYNDVDYKWNGSAWAQQS